MRFDLGLMGPFTDQIGPDPVYRSPDRLRDFLELAPKIEEHGFEKVWLTERHFDQNALSSVLPYCAALAARTDNLKIGTGVALAPFYHALRFAEDSALVDIVSDGRFEPGLAIGWKPETFEAFGVEKRRRVPHLEETIEILRQAWSDGPVSHTGDVYDIDGIEVFPKPEQRPPPIWIGGTADPAVERAARIGDGYYATATPLDELVRKQRLCDRVSGIDDFPVAEWRYTHVSQGDAWKEVKQSIWHIRRKYMEIGTGEKQPQEMPTDLEAEIRKECLVGTPDEVADEIRARENSMGENYRLVARMGLPGMPTDEVRQTLELFCDEVIASY